MSDKTKKDENTDNIKKSEISLQKKDNELQLSAQKLLSNLRNPDSQNHAVDKIEEIGKKEILAMREMSPILDKSIAHLTTDKDSNILKGLSVIRSESASMDKENFNFSPNFFMALLQKITGNTPLAQYLGKFESAKDIIQGISKTFVDGQIMLREDNVLMLHELDKFKKNRDALNEQIHILQETSKIVDSTVNDMQDGEDKNFLISTISHTLATKTMDLQQILAVTQQGEFGFNIIIKGNRELIKSIDRVQSVTIPALQIAAMMALVLSNQKKVYDSTEAVARETDLIISKNADMMVEQSKKIAGQSNTAMQSVDQIAINMKKMIDSVDTIENARLAALPEMNNAINLLKGISDEANNKLETIYSQTKAEDSIVDPDALLYLNNSKKGE